MASEPKRPKPRSVGSVRVEATNRYRSEDGRWYCRGVVHELGQRRTIWTGWATQFEAERAVAALVAAGQASAEVRQVERPAELTMGDLVDFWAGAKKKEAEAHQLTTNSFVARRNAGRRLVANPAVARLRVDSLAELARAGKPVVPVLQELLVEHVAHARAKGRADRSIQLECKVFREAWTYGVEMGLAPATVIRLPRLDLGEASRVNNHYTPSRAEVLDVVRHLDGWARMAVLFLAYTGVRIGELAPLRWADLDLQRHLVTVSGRDPEAGRVGKGAPRLVPLVPALVDALEAFRPADWSASDRLLGVTAHTVRGRFHTHITEACEAAGRPRWSAHALRRMVAGEALDQNMSLPDYRALMGHSPQTAVRDYARGSLPKMAEALTAATAKRKS